MPSFQPYWGKPAVRNDRGDRGDVGIIRSPVRASILPDYIGSIAPEASCELTAVPLDQTCYQRIGLWLKWTNTGSRQTIRQAYDDSASSNALASFRSGVSKPSVNRP